MVGHEWVRGEGVVGDAPSNVPSQSATSHDPSAPRRRRPARENVVRPLGLAVERPCSRPGCSTPARATLRFSYVDREASIERLTDEPAPQAYDLCTSHAARTRPPHGWSLEDRRPDEERRPDAPPPSPADLGGDRTVAVLAAALRAAPDAVAKDDAAAYAAGAGVADPSAGQGDAALAPPTHPGAGDGAQAGHGAAGQPRPPLAARQAVWDDPDPAPRETA